MYGLCSELLDPSSPGGVTLWIGHRCAGLGDPQLSFSCRQGQPAAVLVAWLLRGARARADGTFLTHEAHGLAKPIMGHFDTLKERQEARRLLLLTVEGRQVLAREIGNAGCELPEPRVVSY